MSFKYSLIPNKLTPDPDDYLAVPQDTVIKTKEDIIKEITGEGSILKETESYAVVNAFFKRIADNLEQGIGFSCEYFTIKPAIQGVFMSEDDHFDDERHLKYPNLYPSEKLKLAVEKMDVTRVSPTTHNPTPKRFYDIISDTTNDRVTPGSTAELHGERLKVETEDEAQGVYFIHAESREETKVERYHTNYPKTLMIIVPSTLQPGTYQLEVRNTPYRVKTLKTGVLDYLLTVE